MIISASIDLVKAFGSFCIVYNRHQILCIASGGGRRLQLRRLPTGPLNLIHPLWGNTVVNKIEKTCKRAPPPNPPIRNGAAS
jgi:hypothetical protein